MTVKNTIAAVVVTYNRRALLKDCIDRLLAQKNAACDILVVDNASTDGTPDMVAAMTDSRVRYRCTGENLGGAGGFHFGMRWAVEDGYERVWLMDDDTLPEPDALRALIEAEARVGDGYGFLSSVPLWTHGTGCVINRPGVAREYEKDLSLLGEGLIRIEQATFVSMFLPAGVIRRYGLPIRQFFIWADDIEYSRRLCVRGGLPSYLVGNSHVVHMTAQNVGSDLARDCPERIDRYRLAYRNECYLFRQEGVRGRLHYLRRCAAAFKGVLFRARDHRLRRIAALLRGMAEGIVFRPGVEFAARGEED